MKKEEIKDIVKKDCKDKKSKFIKKIIVMMFFITTYIAVVYGINSEKFKYDAKSEKTLYEVAKVLEVVEDKTTIDKNSDNIKKGSTTLKIKMISGEYKGKEYTIINYYSAMFNVDVKEGDKISVRIDKRADGELDISVYNYYRVGTIAAVIILFAVVLIVIGGKKGFRALVGLVFTLVNVVFILLPLALKGISPVFTTIFVVMLSTVMSFILLDGISRKTIIATLGTIIGILVGTVFGLLASKIMSITTYQMDEAEQLLLTMSTSKLQPGNLLLCGIMISCMGAVMDVAMSIASAIEELYTVNKELTMRELYKSGMNIGRDAMGTMANTLILAFAGNSLNMLILISSYNVTFTQLINTDFVALEIIKALSGSIGIIVAVPVVACIASYMVRRINFNS